MKFILFLLLVFLPIVFSIDQISDDQTQPTTLSDSQASVPTENSATSQVETKGVEDSNQAPPQAESKAPQSDPQPTEAKPQTTSQETQQVVQKSNENEEKSTTSITKTPTPVTNEATKSTKTQQNSQTYVSKDDDSSCKGLCLSGGICKNDVCICPPGFSGARCELVFDANESKYQTKMDSVVTKYYYTLIGFVGLVAVMVLSECCCKGESESAPKDIPVDRDQDQKYVDLDLEAAAHNQDKNYVDVEADVAPVQEEQQYAEPEVVHAEEDKNYPAEEVVIVPVEEEQNYVEPEVVHVEEEQNYVEPELVAQEE